MAADLDHAHLSLFYSKIPDRESLSRGALADLFSYYLQVEKGLTSVETSQLKKCFVLCDLGAPTWLASHLTNNSKGKSATYVKASKGYRLHAHARERIAKTFGNALATVQSSIPLQDIYASLADGPRKEFLREAIDCYGIGCNRAAIVLFWSFLLDHLFELVLLHHQTAFNLVLSKNLDKRVKVTSVNVRDDFSDIPEGKFVEFLRAASIISGDVKKILEQKLGTRNTAAHPSTVKIQQSRTNDFFDDLIENVYRKYPL